MSRQVLTEATTTTAGAPISAVTGSAGKFLVQLITPGWGSSGYYSPEVLEAAAKAKVFPAGLQMYLDHEQLNGAGLDLHGNRSVKDVSAVLEGDATWNGEALVAIATVFGPYRDALSHMAESIGVSIRASADVTFGEAEGKQGTIVNELVEGYSCDFVTRAGRGGKILQVIESARSQLGEASANDTLQALSDAVQQAYGSGDDIYSWVRDYDPDAATVVFDVRSPGQADTFQQTYEIAADGEASLTGERTEVNVRTTYVPVNPTGRTTNQEVDMPEIAESELRTLREAHGRVLTLESERDAAVTRAETAESERDTERARADAAEARIAESDRATTIARVLTEAITAANGIPLNEFERTGVAARAVTNDQGAVDESATRTAFDTALATIAESRGHGRPRGLGGPIPGEQQESTKDLLAELDAVSESAFGSQGLTIVKEA